MRRLGEDLNAWRRGAESTTFVYNGDYDDEARRILAEVTRAVAHWRQVAGRHGLTGSEFMAMEPAFAALSTQLGADLPSL